jgi:hypothetical protein
MVAATGELQGRTKGWLDVNIDEFLTRLTKVQKAGPGKWRARCPAHESNSPSLAISEKNGTILLKCFVGCAADDICGALGIEMYELFPPRDPLDKYDRQPVAYVGGIKFTALDALRCLSNEGGVVLLAACDQAEGKCLDSQECDRLLKSVSRLTAALEFLGEHETLKPNFE